MLTESQIFFNTDNLNDQNSWAGSKIINKDGLLFLWTVKVY